MTEIQKITPEQAQGRVTFVREIKDAPLFKTQKALLKITPQAVALLKNTMNDETKDIKTRLDCANKLIEYGIKVSDSVEQQQMARLVAEFKSLTLSAKSKNMGSADSDEDDTVATFDANTIADVSKLQSIPK